MALTYVYLVSPATGAAATPAGTRYTPNAAGVISGVAAADAVSLQGVGTAQLQLLLATGATADRPNFMPTTALTGALNNANPAAVTGLPFYDTTLSKTVYFVGTQRSATGWIDQGGNAL
jgi:hypothetical protein